MYIIEQIVLGSETSNEHEEESEQSGDALDTDESIEEQDTNRQQDGTYGVPRAKGDRRSDADDPQGE